MNIRDLFDSSKGPNRKIEKVGGVLDMGMRIRENKRPQTS